MQRLKLLCKKLLLVKAAVLFASSPLFALQLQPVEDTFRSLLQRGFAYHQQANYKDALPLLRQAYRLDPHDYFVNLLLGIDLLRTSEAQEAIEFLGAASRLRPKEDFPYEYAGEAQTVLGHYDAASTAYLKAVSVAPETPEALEGWIDFTLERFRQLAGQLRSTQSGLAAEYRLQARSYAAGDAKRRALLQQSAALDSAAPGIWSELALADLQANDTIGAQQDVQKATAANSFDLDAVIAQAFLAAKSGHWTNSISLLNQVAASSGEVLAAAAAIWPSALQPEEKASGAAASFLSCARQGDRPCKPANGAINRRGEINSSTRAMLFQRQQWDRLIAQQPPPASDRVAWFQRGVAFVQSAKCNEAIPALERGLLAGAQPVYARFLLSWCYADAAGKIDERIRRTGGDLAVAHMIRGDVFFRMQGNAEAAIAEYQAAIAVRRDDPKLLERLAEAQVSAGDLISGEQNARSALALDAHRYSARQTLARVAIDQGNYAEALPQLTLLAAQDPRDQGVQISLATTLSQLGNSSEALLHLEPVLAGGYPDQKGNLHSLLGALLRKTGRTADAAAAFAEARRLSEAYQQRSHRDQDDPR